MGTTKLPDAPFPITENHEVGPLPKRRGKAPLVLSPVTVSWKNKQGAQVSFEITFKDKTVTIARPGTDFVPVSETYSGHALKVVHGRLLGKNGRTYLKQLLFAIQRDHLEESTFAL